MKSLFTLSVLLFSISSLASPELFCDSKNSQMKTSVSIDTRMAKLTMTNLNDQIPHVFDINSSKPGSKEDPELSKAIGESTTHYVVYTVTSAADGEATLVIANGISKAKYLVLIGPMAKLYNLGSTASCK